jgi:hypothetical protein
VLRQDEPFGKIYVDVKEAELAKGLKKEDVDRKPEVKEEKAVDDGTRKPRRIKEKA